LESKVVKFEVGDFGDLRSGSCLQGYVNTTYSDLVATFGPSLGSGDKTTQEWVIIMFDEDEDQYHTVSIYDWKYDTTPTHRCDWHIGADNQSDVECFRKLYTKGQVRGSRW